MQKTKKKNYAIVVLVVLLIALAVGYAAGQTVLTVNGTAKGNYNWDVKFTAASFKDENGDAVSTDKAEATISTTTSDSDTVTANVKNLAYPGDGVVLETTITNSSTVPAKLSDFVITPETDEDLEVTVADGFATGEVIPAGGSCTVQFLVKWKGTSTATTLDKTFTITFTYDQDTTEFTPTLTHTDA